MTAYICKCGQRVQKSGSADNTGNRLEGYGRAINAMAVPTPCRGAATSGTRLPSVSCRILRATNVGRAERSHMTPTLSARPKTNAPALWSAWISTSWNRSVHGSKILSLWANSLAAFLKTRFAPLITPTMAATAVHSSALPTKRALLPRQLCSPDFLIRMEAART